MPIASAECRDGSSDLHNAVKLAKNFNISPAQTLVPLVGTINVRALGAETTQGMVLLSPSTGDSTMRAGPGAAVAPKRLTASIDHLVRAQQKRYWEFNSDCLGGSAVHDHLYPRCLFDWDVAGIRASK